MKRLFARAKAAPELMWILVVSVITRLYGLTMPLTDGGQERSTQVAMIARNLLHDRFDVLHPRMDTFAPDIGYVLLEFPLQPAIMAAFYSFFGIHDEIGRLVAILFSLGGIAYFWGLAGFFLSRRMTVWATAAYALTPMSIFFGRSVCPEPLLLFFSLGAFYHLLKWESEGKRSIQLALSIFHLAWACLVKPPPAGVLLIPLLILLWQKGGGFLRNLGRATAYVALVLAPLMAWAMWSRSFSSKMGWMPYQTSSFQNWGVPYMWYEKSLYLWLAKSIPLVTLFPVIFVFAVLGFARIRRQPRRAVLAGWFVAMVIYVFLTPSKQATHWSYQVPLIPLGAVLAGIGLAEALAMDWTRSIINWFKERTIIRRASLALVILLHLAIYAVVIKEAYDPIKRLPFAHPVAQAVKASLPKEGFVILIQPGVLPTAQVYYMDRRAHHLPEENKEDFTFEEFKRWEQMGATGVVVVDTPYGSGTMRVKRDSQLRAYLQTHFETVIDTAGYMIFSRRAVPPS